MNLGDRRYNLSLLLVFLESAMQSHVYCQEDTFLQNNKQCGTLFCVRYPIFLFVNFFLITMIFSIFLKTITEKVVNKFINYLCVFISFRRKGFSWLNETNVMPEFRSGICCGSIPSFISASKTSIQTGNSAKECQLNRIKPRKVKEDSYRLSKKWTVKKHKAYFPSSTLLSKTITGSSVKDGRSPAPVPTPTPT